MPFESSIRAPDIQLSCERLLPWQRFGWRFARQCNLKCKDDPESEGCSGYDASFDDASSKALCISEEECRAACTGLESCYGIDMFSSGDRCYLNSRGNDADSCESQHRDGLLGPSLAYNFLGKDLLGNQSALLGGGWVWWGWGVMWWVGWGWWKRLKTAENGWKRLKTAENGWKRRYRDLSAVNAEHEKNIGSPERRAIHMLRDLMPPSSPSSHFYTGNSESLLITVIIVIIATVARARFLWSETCSCVIRSTRKSRNRHPEYLEIAIFGVLHESSTLGQNRPNR